MSRALNPAPEIDLHIIGEYSGSESYDEDALDATNIPTGTAQPDLEPDDSDFPVYAVINGREKTDTGLYNNWADVSHRVQGVSSNSHVKCVNLAEAKFNLEKAGINKAQIDKYISNVREARIKNTSTRTLRQRKKKDYRSLNGERSKNEDNRKSDKNEEKTPLQQPDGNEKETENEALREQIAHMRKKSEQDDISITAMQEEIADLKQQIQEAKEERESALQKVKDMEDKVKTAERRKPQLTAIEEKVQINLVADSNRKTIIEPLRKALPEFNIIKHDQMFTTTHVLEAMNKRSLPDTGITIILMGTNDVKLGETEKAMKNLRKIATKTDNRTLVTHIPPIEMGHPEEDTFEQSATDRVILNRHISTTFPNNHIKTPILQKNHNQKSILTRDGIHLTKEGGEMMATAIAARIQIMTNTNTAPQQTQSPDRQQHNKPPTKRPTTPQSPETADTTPPQQPPTSPDRKQAKKETILVIPPGIGKHVIGRSGKTIAEIKEKCRVEVVTKRSSTDDETRLSIVGAPNRVKEAEGEINKIIAYQLDMQEKERDDKKKCEQATCSYYLAGNCRFGKACWKQHPQATGTQYDERPSARHPITQTDGRQTNQNPERQTRPRERNTPKTTSDNNLPARSRSRHEATNANNPSTRSRSRHESPRRPERSHSHRTRDDARPTTHQPPSLMKNRNRDQSPPNRHQKRRDRSPSPAPRRDHHRSRRHTPDQPHRSIIDKFSDFLKGGRK